MAEALLVTRQDLVKFTSLNGNVDTDNFIQYVKIQIYNYLYHQQHYHMHIIHF